MPPDPVILEKLKEKFPTEIVSTNDSGEMPVAVIKKAEGHSILSFMKEEPALRFDFLIDLTAIDRQKLGGTPRFEVVYHLYSVTLKHRLRLKIQLPEEDLRLASAVDLWKSANWMERECAEMFGILFEGHPNPKKLLLFEGFEGYPLRKDYPIDRRQKIPVPEEKL
ncbi:MAG: NADH-quinone oxidoreductase subunit C [Deltaproteobacteria bacterium]|nr:NADH-quinone oxidoreductase subunit C [Deltaproteobacteria bacterium]